MSEKDSRSPQEQKRLADAQTPYLTFLPRQEEGFDPGLHTQTGILTDGGAQPRRWLEDFALHLDTLGAEEAAFAIPDALAVEQMTRRLLRTPPEADVSALGAWRGVLALLLLWDGWEKNDSWPELSLEDFSEAQDPFTCSVRNALNPQRREEGLRLFALRAPGEEEKRPLGLLSRRTLITPAADPGDLTGLLPGPVRWYDAAQGGFLDPCGLLPATERARLAAQLRLLIRLAETEGSGLYDPEARLVAPLGRFLEDLRLGHREQCQAVAAEDGQALRQLEVRVKAVYALRHEADFPGIASLEEELDAEALESNPLIRCFLPEGAALPPAGTPARQTLWRWRGIPFAREDGELLLGPTGDPREAEALEALGENLQMLESCSPGFRARLADRLTELCAQAAQRENLLPRVRTLLGDWQRAAAEELDISEQELHLTWPPRRSAPAIALLLREYLGLDDGQVAQQPFSPLLTLVDGAAEDALGDQELSQCCRLPGTLAFPACGVIPPLSAALCQALTDCARREGGCFLVPDKLRFHRPFQETAERVEASLTLSRVQREDAAELTRTVVLHQTYEAGQIYHVPYEQLPTVTVWPCVPFRQAQWRRYYVYAHRAESLDVWGLADGVWRQGRVQQAQRQSWQVLPCERYPDYVLVRKGALDCGALPNPLPAVRRSQAESAVMALDFGSTGTAVCFRQGEKTQPARTACLQRTLLHGPFAAPLCDEFLPNAPMGNIRFSAMDMFGDDPAAWREPLLDGHAFTPTSLEAICRKEAGRLYYGLKWGREDFRRRLNELFLHQAMTESVLAAHLSGAPDVSWRVAMPAALPLEMRRTYLAQVQLLARQVSQETGVPLTEGVPAVAWADESAAVGAYFRSRNEVNIHGAYLTLDVGGGSAELAYFPAQGGASRSCSLPLGAQSMLFEALTAHPDRLEEDFARLPDHPKLLKELKLLARPLSAGRSSPGMAAKCRFLLDAFFGEHLYALSRHMNERYLQGRCTYTQALLLMNFAYLLLLLGQLGRESGAEGPLPVCLAGRGTLWLQRLSSGLKERLLGYLRPAAGAGVAPPVISAEPKQEVAQGLLMLEALSQEPPREDAPQPGASATVPLALLTDFFLRFRQDFPQAATRVLPALYDDAGNLTPEARMTLETIHGNYFPCPQGETLPALARCLEAVKQGWQT